MHGNTHFTEDTCDVAVSKVHSGDHNCAGVDVGQLLHEWGAESDGGSFAGCSLPV